MKKSLIIIGCLLLVIAIAAAIGYEKYGPIKVPGDGGELVEIEGLLEGFTLPAGFTMSVYADGIADARVMEFGPSGEILVSQPSKGTITAIVDRDGDGKAEIKTIVASGLTLPHGLAFRCDTECVLYVAETDGLYVFDYDAATMKATNRTKLLELPRGSTGTHFTRSIAFMPYPDHDTLLVSIGSSCNVCDESDSRRAKVLAYDVKTGEMSEFASGLRNAVFIVTHPVTGDMWVTEMGRDGLGDDIPPDEINILKEGANYGWPICYGKNIHDTAFDKKTYIRNPCMEPFEIGSHIDIPAHSAPLGFAFVPEEGWDENMWYDALVAYHGSWNRSVPTGYKIVRMKLDAHGAYQGVEDFITGWLRPDGTKVGRPVDIKAMPGGTIFISDDHAGVVYRVVKR
ncbi:MAG: PQQ-dependent sugar dehydrogenase [bacterium]|nr:PQQ-dependent sugar dehydrogenase [bacterium]